MVKRLGMRQRCPVAAQKVSLVLGCVKGRGTSRWTEVLLPLRSCEAPPAPLRPVLRQQKDMDLLKAFHKSGSEDWDASSVRKD